MAQTDYVVFHYAELAGYTSHMFCQNQPQLHKDVWTEHHTHLLT